MPVLGIIGKMGEYLDERGVNALWTPGSRKVSPDQAQGAAYLVNDTWHGDQNPAYSGGQGPRCSTSTSATCASPSLHQLGKNFVQNKMPEATVKLECIVRVHGRGHHARV